MKRLPQFFTVILALLLVFALTVGAFALTYGQEYQQYQQESAQLYSDVPTTHWASRAIQICTERGWFTGYPDGTFHPDDLIRRNEAIKVFVEAIGIALDTKADLTYSDTANNWAKYYIEAGKHLLPNYGDSYFRLEQTITREDTVYALVTAWHYVSETVNADQSVLNMFSDTNSISEAIKPYMAVAVMEGLVAGFPDGTIAAQKGLSRAEFATLLSRALEHGYGPDLLIVSSDSGNTEGSAMTPTPTPEQTSMPETTPTPMPTPKPTPTSTPTPTPKPTPAPTPTPKPTPAPTPTPKPTPEPEPEEPGLPSGTVVNLEELKPTKSKAYSMLRNEDAVFTKTNQTVQAFNRLSLTWKRGYQCYSSSVNDSGYVVYDLSGQYSELNGKFDIKTETWSKVGIGLAFISVDQWGSETLLAQYFTKYGKDPVTIHIDLTDVENLKIMRLPSDHSDWPYDRQTYSSAQNAELYNVTLTVK